MTTEPASVRTISVAICTRNRERLLAGALESLCHVRPPEQMAWQVVIILNDCTDRSSEVVDQFRSRLPIVSDVEPRPGLSRARNRAIDIATGEAIIWIDDDVSVPILLHSGVLQTQVVRIRATSDSKQQVRSHNLSGTFRAIC